MAMPVLDLEESLKEYLKGEDVLSSMREGEFSNLLEGITKGHYKHVEEVIADISELGEMVWMDSMSKSCEVRELGAVKRFATFVAPKLDTEADASSQRARTPSAQRDHSLSPSRASAGRNESTALDSHTPQSKAIDRQRLPSRSRSRSKSRRPQVSQPSQKSDGELQFCETLKESEALVNATLEEMMRMRLRSSCNVVVKLVHVPRKVEHLQKANKIKVQILLAASGSSGHLQEWGNNAEELISHASKYEGHVVKLEDVRFDDFKNVPYLKPGKRFCISAPPTSIPQDILHADAVFTSFPSFASLPPYSRCSIQGVVRSAAEPEGHENSAGLQRHLTDVELVDPKGYLLRVSVWSNSPAVFKVNRKIRMYNVQVNAQYQRGEVSDYSGWRFGSSVPHAQLPREVFVLKWEHSS